MNNNSNSNNNTANASLQELLNNINGIDELVQLKNGVCPVCGRSMVEQEHIC